MAQDHEIDILGCEPGAGERVRQARVALIGVDVAFLVRQFGPDARLHQDVRVGGPDQQAVGGHQDPIASIRAFNFSHMTFGTTPNTEPPSIRQWPSLRQCSSKRPSLRGAAAITRLRGASWDSADDSRPGRRGRGGDEHARERIRRCVTERAQEMTKAFGGNGPMKRQAVPGTRPLKTVVDEIDDRLERGPWTKDLDHPHLLQLSGVVLRDDATPKTTMSVALRSLRSSRMRGISVMWAPLWQADADGVDIFLDGGLDHHLGCLAQPA